ncbi:MAG: sensory rhodopsin transducer [Gemmatimonadota bacterium]
MALAPASAMEIGRRVWAIAEGYIPSWSHGPEPQMLSHETVCLLNASDRDARVELTAYSNREPVQHTRLDSRQAENALLSTIAFAADE